MSDNQSNHLVWLERMIPQHTDTPHWLVHDAKDGDSPNEDVTDNIYFKYCPLCGANLLPN